MNSIALTNTAPQQLSTGTRIAAAVAVVVFLAAAWASAGQASHTAVVSSIGALNATHITLQWVEESWRAARAPRKSAPAPPQPTNSDRVNRRG